MKKKFDAVRMMRSIRDELSKRYMKSPDLETKELKEIREKYGIKGKEKDSPTLRVSIGSRR